MKKCLSNSVFRSIAVVFLFPGLMFIARSQPSLQQVRLLNSAYPNISLSARVECAGHVRYDLTQDNFTIKENGRLISDFSLISPAPLQPCCLSIGFVIERSGTGSSDLLNKEKAGVRAFIDTMDTRCDEATLLSFATTVSIGIFMTTDQDLLKAGLNRLVPGGVSKPWEGVYSGIVEVANNGMNDCRIVVLLRYGEYYSQSSRSAEECIALARKKGIRVFTIGIGKADTVALKKVADETGGRFFHDPTGGNLPALMRRIYAISRSRFEEYKITYKSTCADSSFRTVEVTVGSPREISANAGLGLPGCPGTDTKTISYRAPYDPSTYTPLNLKLGDVCTKPGRIVELPLVITDSIHGYLSAGAFTIGFDPAKCSFIGVRKSGTLLDSTSLSIQGVVGGQRISFNDIGEVTGKGTLLALRFLVTDTNAFHYPITVELRDWMFSGGCFTPVLNNGAISLGTPSVLGGRPATGTYVCTNSTLEIEWNAICVSLVRIELSNDAGQTYQVLADSIPASLGSWKWTPPSSLKNGYNYHIRVSDVADTVVRWISPRFIVAGSPVVQDQPGNTMVCKGSSAYFKVGMATTLQQEIQWQVSSDGGASYINLPNSNTDSLVIGNTTFGMDGYRYRARVTNECGAVYSDAAVLRVVSRPSIVNSPTDVTACVGTIASFVVRVDPSSAASIRWQKAASQTTAFRDIQGATDSVLSVNIADAAMNGTRYRAIATNACDSVVSSVATLYVRDVPVVAMPLLDKFTCEGNAVSFLVAAQNARSFQWQKNGADIPGATSSRLTLTRTSRNDAGTYRVLVGNDCGTTVSNDAMLTVGSIPSIRSQPVSRSVTEGDTVSLAVRASGGALKYQWFKDGVMVPGASDSVLQFVPVFKNDEGRYVVVITNPCGAAISDTIYMKVSIATGANNVPVAGALQLSQNYPNPFGPLSVGNSSMTTITYTIPSNGYVTLDIVNIYGEMVTTLVHQKQGKGRYHVTWDGEAVGNGVYYYRLRFRSESSGKTSMKMRKLVMVK